jgi:hypothetical protein
MWSNGKDAPLTLQFGPAHFFLTTYLHTDFMTVRETGFTKTAFPSEGKWNLWITSFLVMYG